MFWGECSQSHLKRGLSQSVIPIEAAVIEQLRLLGKRFGEKGEANVKKSEAMAVLRAVVATNVETGKPYKTLSEAFAADDLKNHPEDVDDEGARESQSDAIRIPCMTAPSRPHSVTYVQLRFAQGWWMICVCAGGDDDDTSDDLKTEMWGLFSRRAAMERISK